MGVQMLMDKSNQWTKWQRPKRHEGKMVKMEKDKLGQDHLIKTLS